MLVWTEDEQLLADSAAQVIREEAPVGRFRAMRDAGRTHDPELWAQLCELGWPGIAFDEADGGLGMGLSGLVVVMEALGRTLAPTPLLSTLLAGLLDPGSGSPEGRVVALAHLDREPTRVTERGLVGVKDAVLDGTAAEAYVVSARDPDDHGQIALYRIERSEVEVVPLVRMDYRDCARIHLDGARGERLPGGLPELERALDHGTVALCAEMLGGAEAAFERTLAYLKEREQFGVAIGSFQVLQHRAVDAFVAIELARSTVMAAARDPSPELVSLAKARCNDTFLDVATDAVQMHGGIGMTDEHDIGLYLKRARVASQTLGTSRSHRDRWARLHGY